MGTRHSQPSSGFLEMLGSEMVGSSATTLEHALATRGCFLPILARPRVDFHPPFASVEFRSSLTSTVRTEPRSRRLNQNPDRIRTESGQIRTGAVSWRDVVPFVYFSQTISRFKLLNNRRF